MYKLLGIKQYSLIGVVQSFVNNFENTIRIDFILKILISIIASVIVYISISFFAVKNSYNKTGIKVGYKSFVIALWYKYILVMLIVLAPLKLITEITNNIRVQGFIGYLLVFVLIIVKSTVFFFVLQVVSIDHISKVYKASANRLKQVYGSIGVMCLTIIMILIT